MPGQKSTAADRRRARGWWENGESLAWIAEQLGVTPKTVGNWKKKDKWSRGADPEPTPAALNDNPVDIQYAQEQPVAEATNEIPQMYEATGDEAELRARIAELEAANDRLTEQVEDLKPTKDIQAMIDDRVQWLTDNSPEGDRYWLNRAEAEFKAENRQRAKDGLTPFNINEFPDMLDDLINQLKTKEAMAGAQEPSEPPSRRVKMFVMRNGMPTIEQIPMENQINNMKGSLADGIIRYTRKGFKLTEPFLCPRAGCFRPAASDEFGRWQWDGYCSETHRREVEGDAVSAVAGFQVQTKDTMIGV